jgi:hypothetical protein
MVLLGRIELPTSPLPRVRSTTELQQQHDRTPVQGHRQARAIVGLDAIVKQGLNRSQVNAKALRMSEPPRNNITQPAASRLSREDRLAARLRENLRRRKAQARQMGASASESTAQTLPKPTSES